MAELNEDTCDIASLNYHLQKLKMAHYSHPTWNKKKETKCFFFLYELTSSLQSHSACFVFFYMQISPPNALPPL